MEWSYCFYAFIWTQKKQLQNKHAKQNKTKETLEALKLGYAPFTHTLPYVSLLYSTVFYTGSNRIPVTGIKNMKVSICSRTTSLLHSWDHIHALCHLQEPPPYSLLATRPQILGYVYHPTLPPSLANIYHFYASKPLLEHPASFTGHIWSSFSHYKPRCGSHSTYHLVVFPGPKHAYPPNSLATIVLSLPLSLV